MKITKSAMPYSRPTQAFIPPRYYAVLLDTLVELGHERGSLLEATALDLVVLGDDDAFLTLAQVEALVERACALENTDDLGLRVGQRLQILSHGPLSIAALTASTARQALASILEFFPLLMPLFSLEVHDYGESTGIRLDVRFPLSSEVERFHTATMSGSLYAQLRFILGGAIPKGVEVSARHPRPPGLPPWVDEIGVALHFDQPHYEIRVPTRALSLTMPLADPRAHELARRRCRELLDARPDPTRLSSAVARYLASAGPPFPSLEATSRTLSLSGRSLRRRLGEEGTSFRAVLEEVRLALADEWLSDPRRTITEIGLSLGYTDAANFSRAYRRARGMSPAKARTGPARDHVESGNGHQALSRLEPSPTKSPR